MGPLGIAVTPDGGVLAQSNLGGPPASALWWALRDMEGPVRRLEGTWTSLLTFAARSYAHWLLDALPRVPVALEREPGCGFVVPAEPPAFVTESLSLLGVAEDRVAVHGGGVLGVERLLLARTAENLADPLPSHLVSLRDRVLRAAYGDAPVPDADRRLWVSRAGAVRPVVNEEALRPVLDAHGLEVVASEDLPFRAQVELFSRASVVAGAHGAGLHNHLFNPGDATVVDLLNPRLWTPSVQRTASACRHRHVHAFVENAGRRFESRVDPDSLRRLFDHLWG